MPRRALDMVEDFRLGQREDDEQRRKASTNNTAYQPRMKTMVATPRSLPVPLVSLKPS